MSSHEKRRGAHTNMTLADLIGLIANDPTLEDNRRRWCTAMEGIARGLGKPPSILPADPKKLIALLSKEQGARRRADVAKSTWTTYTAQYRAATRHVGLAPGPARVDTPRSPAWRELLATRTRSECNYLSRFAGMMTEQGVEPTQVTSAHFETYRDYVHAAAVREPEKAYDGACWAWSRVCNDNPEFLECSPPRAYRRRSYWLEWSAFPPELEAEIDAYYADQSSPQSLDMKSLFKPAPGGSRRGGKGGKGIQRSTIRNYKNYLQALASAAVEAGIRAESVNSLERLVSPSVHEPAIAYLLQRSVHDQQQRGAVVSDDAALANKYVYNILHHVKTIMIRRFGWRKDQLACIEGALLSLSPDNRMSPRTRQRIGVLREPRVFRRLFLLPEQIYAELERVDDPTAQHAWRAAVGLLLAIDLDTAFRRSNAIKLSKKNFGRRDRRTGRLPVEIPPEDAKTDQPYMAELRPRTVGLLDRFVARWRPLLGNADSPYLFPLVGLDDEREEQVALAGFAGRLCRLVEGRLGVTFNLHVLRGLLATLYAEANPSDILTAQVKLGHADPRTTRRSYIDVQQTDAIRRFDAVVDRVVRGAEPPRVRARMEAVHDVF